MKRLALAALLLAVGCAAPREGPAAVARLAAADAATALIVGQTLEMSTRSAAVQGDDPLIVMTLRHGDGRVMSFEQSNHAPDHLRAQAAGGPLAQIMGLGETATPTLYSARSAENSGAPFLCGPDGPAGLGVNTEPDGAIRMVGLKQPIEFETLRDGTQSALPYSPDMVCARLTFRRS